MADLIETPPVIDGNAAVLTLATGEKVRVSLIETGLGLYGYAVKVMAERTILVKPSSGNAIDIYTPRSVAAEDAENKRIVAERSRGVRACATCGGSREVRGWETIHGKRRAVVNNCPDCTPGVPEVDPAQAFTEPGERRWSSVLVVLSEAMERAVRAFDTGTADDYSEACIAFDDAASAELDRITSNGVPGEVPRG